MASTSSQHFWRAASLLLRLDIAGGVAIAAALLIWMTFAAAGAELPPVLGGSWTKQADAPTANPTFVVLDNGAATIDGERCALSGLRAIHTKRWYADFTCSAAGDAHNVWLDVNLISANRAAINRRPLAEADIYVRDGAK